jgi:uroporphyrinogen-III synthase
MHILLLRAAQDAARTAQELRSRHHSVVLSSIIEIVPTKTPLPGGTFDGLIVTSAQAFASMDPAVVPSLRPLPFFSVGTRAGLAALKLGLSSPRLIGTDAKSLLRQITEKYPKDSHFLYLAGEDRKPDLEDGLAAAGYKVTLHETYRAEPAAKLTVAARSALEHDEVDVILHYSRRSAEIFLYFALQHKFDLSTTAHLCLSADVAVPLQEAYFDNIVVADIPNEISLLEKLGRMANGG